MNGRELESPVDELGGCQRPATALDRGTQRLAGSHPGDDFLPEGHEICRHLHRHLDAAKPHQTTWDPWRSALVSTTPFTVDPVRLTFGEGQAAGDGGAAWDGQAHVAIGAEANDVAARQVMSDDGDVDRAARERNHVSARRPRLRGGWCGPRQP